MTARSVLRGLGYMLKEVEAFVPWQAWRCALGTDFAWRQSQAAFAHDAMVGLDEFEEANEVHEPRTQCLRCGGVDTDDHQCGRKRHCPCGSATCGVCCNAAPQLPLSDSELAAVRRLMTVCDGVNFGRLSGGDYEPSLDDDELVAVRGLIQERYETLNGRMPQEKIPAGVAANGTAPAGPDLSPLASARLGGSPVGVESPAPPAGVDPPSRTSPKGDGEGPEGDRGIRSSAPSGHLNFAAWATTVIAEELADHTFGGSCECRYVSDSTDRDWQLHVAREAARSIEAALTREGKHVIVTSIYQK